ncbi:MAG: hypothetical protein GXO63_00685 [Candidatus Micrarchaeota archaeon]|nr:hypothetical protein [Candidatus Micrarchaeota archaeon]
MKVSARGVERISTKSAVVVCKLLRGLKVHEAEKFLTEILEGKRNINGKYYTKTVSGLLRILRSAKKNAEHLGADTEKMKVHITASKGPTVYRRRRSRRFGMRMKSTYVVVELRDENGG